MSAREAFTRPKFPLNSDHILFRDPIRVLIPSPWRHTNLKLFHDSRFFVRCDHIFTPAPDRPFLKSSSWCRSETQLHVLLSPSNIRNPTHSYRSAAEQAGPQDTQDKSKCLLYARYTCFTVVFNSPLKSVLRLLHRNFKNKNSSLYQRATHPNSPVF